MSVSQDQVISLLENVLFESPTQAAANAGTWQANSAATSVASLSAAMANSGEEKIAATVVGYYLSSLGRAPTSDEIHFYVNFAEKGLTQSQIAAGQVSDATWNTVSGYFAHSQEFATRGGLDYSMGPTGALLEAVPWLYQSVLHRTPTTTEISYYDTQISNGADLGTLFRQFTASQEFHTDTDTQIQTALATHGAAVTSGQQTSTTIGATVTLGPPAPATTTTTTTTTSTPTLSWSGTKTGDTTLPSGDTSLIINTSSVTYTDSSTVSDNGNTITTLKFNETGSGSTLGIEISDTALTSVTVVGNIQVGVYSHHEFILDSSITTLDLTQDTDTTDRFFIKTENTSGATVKLGSTHAYLDLSGANDTLIAGNGDNTVVASSMGSGGSFTFGTGTNSLELFGWHGSATVTTGAGASFNASSPTANLQIGDANIGLKMVLGTQTGLTIDTAHHLGSTSNVLTALVGLITTAHQVEYGDDGSNTYIVESDNGTTAAGHVTVIGISSTVVTSLTTDGTHLIISAASSNG